MPEDDSEYASGIVLHCVGFLFQRPVETVDTTKDVDLAL